MVSEEGRQGGGHRGWEGILGRGGGLNIFFRVRKTYQDLQPRKNGKRL